MAILNKIDLMFLTTLETQRNRKYEVNRMENKTEQYNREWKSEENQCQRRPNKAVQL